MNQEDKLKHAAWSLSKRCITNMIHTINELTSKGMVSSPEAYTPALEILNNELEIVTELLEDL